MVSVVWGQVALGCNACGTELIAICAGAAATGPSILVAERGG